MEKRVVYLDLPLGPRNPSIQKREEGKERLVSLWVRTETKKMKIEGEERRIYKVAM